MFDNALGVTRLVVNGNIQNRRYSRRKKFVVKLKIASSLIISFRVFATGFLKSIEESKELFYRIPFSVKTISDKNNFNLEKST